MLAHVPYQLHSRSNLAMDCSPGEQDMPRHVCSWHPMSTWLIN